MGNLEEFAKKELELSGAFDEDSFYGGLVGEAVMELVKVFADQGHSGASAPLVSHIFGRVANWKPLAPLTGEYDEWFEHNEGDADTILWQNKRCFSVFKEGKDGQPYFTEAINWRTPSGAVHGGTVEGNSGTYKIAFPFKPKTFIIDVNEDMTKILDQQKLAEVEQYYPLGLMNKSEQ